MGDLLASAPNLFGAPNPGQNTDLRLIVGFDFGTTYSGLSWVMSNRTKADDVEILNTWPDSPSQLVKTPSRIAYRSENPTHKLNEDKWGYSVRGGMKSYLWTKLLLDKNSADGTFDDSGLKEYFGSGLMSLPAGKSAQKVCSEYMACLYKHFTTRIQTGNKVNLTITPMEVWVTVPAIWSDYAKKCTIQAAKDAGFGSRTTLGDTIHAITEPEAAALTILKPRLDSITLSPTFNNTILVCDCGGGTVDIVCYKVDALKGRPRFRELCMGMGAKCGSTAIDRAFDRWMVAEFGTMYTSLPKQARGPGSKFMEAFESAKRNFDGSDSMLEVYPIHLPGAEASEYYDFTQNTVMLPGSKMQSFFDPVIDDIIRLVKCQLAKAQEQHGQALQGCCLASGFGDSVYLNKRVEEFASPEGISVTCPPKCQASIAVGAALRGLFGLKPDSRVCRRHYGYATGFPFREGIDDEEYGCYRKWDNAKYCSERAYWVAKKEQTVEDSTTERYNISWDVVDYDGRPWSTSVEFYQSEADKAPDSIRHWSVDKVGDIKITFTPGEIAKCKKTRNRKLKKEFRTLIQDREAGYASFEYDKVEKN